VSRDRESEDARSKKNLQQIEGVPVHRSFSLAVILSTARVGTMEDYSG
jgi:hypothetical protein